MRLSRARSIDDLRTIAKGRLPRAVFEFYDGGAEDEVTLRDNREAFQRVRLAPRLLVDVSRVDTGIDLFGSGVRMPMVIAPTGIPAFAWRDGDVAIARAAASCGIPYTLATGASATIERIADEAGGRLWFQAYVFKRREFTTRLIERARAAGYEALVVTLDMPVGGKRERDLRNDFSYPFRFTARNFVDFALHPRWSIDMLARGAPRMENLVAFSAELATVSAGAEFVGRNYDPSFGWEDVRALRDSWPRTFIAKGILRPDDAEQAAALGCDAIVVSNHGGRQLDGAAASLDALPAIAAAVGQRIPVLFDGGIRRGVDVVKALALGARAVLVGRPTLYGLAAGGEAGAAWALDILRDELARSMQLCGLPSIGDIGPDALFRPIAS